MLNVLYDRHRTTFVRCLSNNGFAEDTGEEMSVSEEQRVFLPSPGREEMRLADVLHALSDPVRLQIVRQLATAARPMACGTLGLPVTKSTASHHFKVLREAGVTRGWDVGTQRMNEIRRDDLEARFPGLLDIVMQEGDKPGVEAT